MFSFDKKTIESQKKILCVTMLNKQKCMYGNKCMYAHNLNDQKIEPLRHKVYTIIKCTDDLSTIDLVHDPKLYETLLQLTRICASCVKGQCPGGYNCRNGAVSVKTKICYDDLVYGNCKRNGCTSVHLTQRGLVPYYKQKSADADKTSSNSDEYDDSFDNYQYKRPKYYKRPVGYYKEKTNKLRDELDNVKGVLLTDTFILSKFGAQTVASDISEDDGEDVERMIQYFEQEDENSDDESIFLV